MTNAAVAVINTAALKHNLDRLRSAAPACRLIAVIKANAYGHGIEQVARVLAGADAFGVARVGEGALLRQAGIGTPIILLGGCLTRAELEQAAELDLEIVIHEASHFELLEDLKSGKPLKAWLKLDTGMGRLGFAPDQFGTCMSFLAKLDSVAQPVRLMTHLACADELDNPMTTEQIRRFGEALGAFDGDVSIANSAGVLSWPQSLEPSPELDYRGANWIRPGIALYGASPITGKNARELGLKPAMTFESRLIAVKTIPKGGYVGYGSQWQAERDTVIGVVAAGYGDGYPRHMPEGTPVLINERRAALIGRVSMDMLTVDLTDIPVARVGDRAVLWGDQLPIEEIASRAGTISYALMSGLTGRVERQYPEQAA